MAKQTVPYQDSIALVTGDMLYADWRQAMVDQGQDLVRTYRRARDSGDVQFYNKTLPDGSIEARVLPKGAPIPAEG